MTRTSPSTNVELNGKSAYSLLNSLNSNNFQHIVERHFLREVDLDGWYPLEYVLNALYEIAEQPGAMQDLVSIGIAAVQNVPVPPELVALGPSKFWHMYNDLFKQRHRNGVPGEIVVEDIAVNHLKLTLGPDVLYPDEVMYGIFYAYMRILCKGFFRLSYDESEPRRTEGGESTIIDMTWDF